MARRHQQKLERREAMRRAQQAKHRKQRMKWDAAIALVAVGAFVLVGRGSGEPTPAADFELDQLGGESVSLSDYRGQSVAVTFRHSW